MRGKPRTADCTIFAVCLMVKGRMVVMGGVLRRRKKGRREEGKSRSLCVLRRCRVTTGPKRCVELKWGGQGMADGSDVEGQEREGSGHKKV
jgi:hypothetical protein